MSIITRALEHPVETHAAAALSCQVLESFDAAETVRQQWDQFVVEAGSDLYMTWDWCRLWWQYYGKGRALRIMLLYREDRLLAVVPMFIERIWLGPVYLKIAKIIGSDSSLTLCNPPVCPESAIAVFDHIIGHLIKNEGCDAVSFGQLAGTYRVLGQLREAGAGRPGSWQVVQDRVVGVHTTFDLPETFDAYVSGLSKSQRGNCRRHTRLVETGRKVEVQVISDPAQGLAEFDSFCQLHEAQWMRQGKLGHFRDWPHALEFNRALVERLGGLGYFRLVKTVADQQTVAYEYGFMHQGCWYWRLPARVIGPEWDKAGLGSFSVFRTFAALIPEGARHVEAGIGHYDYKIQWGAQEHPVQSILLVASRLGSRLRCRLFFRMADALHLLYYRMWFLRLAPKLPLKRRPLWRLWIRSRI